MKYKKLLILTISLLAVACKTDVKSSAEFGWNDSSLRNGATIEQNILNLGSTDGYYEIDYVGQKIASLKDFSISVCFMVDSTNTLDGYGHFLFAFSKLAENKAEEGPYVAMRLNEQRFETSTGGWNHEEFIMAGDKPKRNVWIQAIYRQHGNKGELFLDGELIGTNDNMPILSEIFEEAPACCWIGRAPFNGDKYLADTKVAKFHIYDYAIDDTELQKLAEEKISLMK